MSDIFDLLTSPMSIDSGVGGLLSTGSCTILGSVFTTCGTVTVGTHEIDLNAEGLGLATPYEKKHTNKW